ncbi:hypothetical protein V3C40_24035 [Janthinobacterium sp. LS2A]|uniref:hypothetical protein n=1 Tax=Janthinobacterium sp. LS2A TaxID=3118590 RepID=UPI002F929BF2
MTLDIAWFFCKAHASAFPGARFSRTVRQFHFGFTFHARIDSAATQRFKGCHQPFGALHQGFLG